VSDLRDLYQEVILDHNKNPRNFRVIEDADRAKEGHNPLCGDNVTVYLKMKDGVIDDISFQGSGCAISKSSASLMTSALRGKSEADAEKVFDAFHRMVTGETLSDDDHALLGKLEVLEGVREFPARVKCASLAWHTTHAALAEIDEPVSTE